MLPEHEVRVDSYRLEDGCLSLQLTHTPTGLAVDDSSTDRPITARMVELHERLEMMVIELTMTPKDDVNGFEV